MNNIIGQDNMQFFVTFDFMLIANDNLLYLISFLMITIINAVFFEIYGDFINGITKSPYLHDLIFE